VYLKIISDTETPSAADIKRFRDWALRPKRLDHRIDSVSSEVDTAAVGMKTGRASPQRATYVGRTTSLKQDLSSYFGRLATSRCRHRCSTTASRAARLSCRTGAWADPNSTSRWQATMGTEYKAVERYTRGTIMPARQPYRVPLRTTFRATASRRCRSACSIQSNGPPADSQARTQSRGCRGGQLWRRGGQATANTALSAPRLRSLVWIVASINSRMRLAAAAAVTRKDRP
jgi:hypothetical protein